MKRIHLSSHTDDCLYITFNDLCMCVFVFDYTKIIVMYKQSSCDSRSYNMIVNSNTCSIHKIR